MSIITGETLLNNLTELLNHLVSIKNFKSFTLKRKLHECNTVISMLDKCTFINFETLDLISKNHNYLLLRLSEYLDKTNTIKKYLCDSTKALSSESSRKLLRSAKNEVTRSISEVTFLIECFICDVVKINSLRISNSGLLLKH